MVRAYRRYFKRYPRVKKWVAAQRLMGEEQHFCTTLFGMIQTLNVTSGGWDDSRMEAGGEGGGREAYWGNQVLNGPIQGSAHQFLICALVNLIRKRKKYAMLGTPPMEVHDALYFVIEVLQLQKGAAKIKYLLEQESLNTVRKDFPDIEWTVPIVVDLEGRRVRQGTQVKVKEDTTPGMFLIDWFRVCRTHGIEGTSTPSLPAGAAPIHETYLIGLAIQTESFYDKEAEEAEEEGRSEVLQLA